MILQPPILARVENEVVSARINERNCIAVERRVVDSSGVSLRVKVELPSSKSSRVRTVDIAPQGQLVLVSSVSVDAPRTHKTWVLSSKSLKVVGTLSFASPVTDPLWVSPTTFRYLVSDVQRAVLNVEVTPEGKLAKKYGTSRAQATPLQGASDTAIEVLLQRKVEPPVAHHGRLEWSPAAFTNHKGVFVVSREGDLIVVPTYNPRDVRRSLVVVLRKQGGSWSSVTLGAYSFPTCALGHGYVILLDPNAGQGKCNVFSTHTGKRIGEFAAVDADIGAPQPEFRKEAEE